DVPLGDLFLYRLSVINQKSRSISREIPRLVLGKSTDRRLNLLREECAIECGLSANRSWCVGVSSFSSAPPSDARQVSDLPACLISGSAGLRPEAQLGQRPEEQFSSDFGKSETRPASGGEAIVKQKGPGLTLTPLLPGGDSHFYCTASRDQPPAIRRWY